MRVFHLIIALFAMLLLTVSACSSRKSANDPPPKGDVVVLASCDTQGWLEPCGCASGQSGGLSRRATLFGQLTEGRESLLVSAGGAASGGSPYDAEKLRAIVAGEAAMGYVAHNLGPDELMVGIDRISTGDGELRFVATNTIDPDSHTAERSLIVDRSGWRFLILGVMQPGMTQRTEIEDPQSAILAEIEKRKNQYDVAIVLAYMEPEPLAELAANLPEVDLLIGGKTSQSVAPKVFGQTLMTAVSNKGKFVARMAGSISSGDRLNWSADLHEVTGDLKEDPTQRANLVAFRERLEAYDFGSFDTNFGPDWTVSRNSDHSFVGNDRCTLCHSLDDQLWHLSAHAHAWQTLQEAGAHVDPGCQRCHTNGYGYAGGFVRRSESLHRVNVGCESCHGPSSQHAEDPLVRTPWLAADSCVGCHDQENSPHFEYTPYWQKIIHGETKPAGPLQTL